MLFGLAWWNTAAAEPSELYQRLGLEKTATSAEIRRAYHAQARQTHPDKVEGDKAAAAENFKRLAEAYEVLTDKKLRVEYDRTGRVPDDRAKAAANQQSTGEEEEFGYGGGRPAPSAPQGQWGGRRYESYDAFEVRLAQGRARRARSLAQLRKHLHAVLNPNPNPNPNPYLTLALTLTLTLPLPLTRTLTLGRCLRSPTARRSGTGWWASTARATRRRLRIGSSSRTPSLAGAWGARARASGARLGLGLGLG